MKKLKEILNESSSEPTKFTTRVQLNSESISIELNIQNSYFRSDSVEEIYNFQALLHKSNIDMKKFNFWDFIKEDFTKLNKQLEEKYQADLNKIGTIVVDLLDGMKNEAVIKAKELILKKEEQAKKELGI